MAASGTQSTGALTANKTYSLVCSGAGGTSTSASATVTIAPVPTVTLTANPTSVASGGSSTLTWSSINATGCTASGSWSGNLAANGSQSTGAITANKTYSLVCNGTGGSSTPASATVTIAPVPTVTLAANPTSVASGGSSTLTWTSTNAASCTASGSWSGNLAANGSQSTGAITVNKTYSLACAGTGGNSTPATATVTIAAVPTVTLTANPTSVASGGSSTLTWTSTNATTCTASGSWSGNMAANGSQNTGAITANKTYSLVCSGIGGSSTPASATVTIAAVPTATLSAAPNPVAAGNASTLTWTSTNATSCTAGGSWTGTKAVNGTQSTGAVNMASLFTLTCTGAGGTSSTASVTVNVVPTAALSANPTAVASGGASTLTWSSANATACTASNGWAGTLGASGNRSTGALTATTTFSLVCNGAGGTSATQTVTVTISSGTFNLSPTHAELTLTQTKQFTATVPGGGGANWTVDGNAGGNGTVGTVDNTGLYTAGTAPGQHTVVATSIADATQSGSAVVSVTDLAGVYSYHNNTARDGTNTKEYALTASSVTTAKFGKLTSCTTDGVVYAQPLWMANVSIGGATHNVVFAATQHDGLYAIDADAVPCAILWQVNLADTAHGANAGETAVPNVLVGNGNQINDISPEIGITGTPVIDPASGTLYVVAKTVNAAHNTFYSRIHAIDITSGAEKANAPLLITATFPGTGDHANVPPHPVSNTTITFDQMDELQRPGLALVNGQIYVAFAGHEDVAPWHGWMIAYSYSTNAGFVQTSRFLVAPNKQRGGIWMSGGAPASDIDGNIYAITGNGTFDASSGPVPGVAPNNDYGDSMLKLSPNLTVSDYYTPPDQANLAANDTDFSSGGATLLADLPNGSIVTHALICAGKNAQIYVLNRDGLGGYNSGQPGLLSQINVGQSIFATGAFWNGTFYVGAARGNLLAYQFNSASGNLGTADNKANSTSTAHYGFPGATPSISSSGTQNGIVWSIESHAYCTTQSQACGPAVLYAHNPANLGNEYWNSSTTGNDTAGNAVKFTVPTIANGHVYIGNRGNNTGGSDASTSTPGELDIYGLK